ncbi:putative ribosome recycling factor [Pillotina sp. SPG140]|jgi:ribosome recycling factor
MDKEILSTAEGRMKKTLLNVKESFTSFRTGRASPALLDRLYVECYGDKVLLNQVANVSAPEARLLVIQPFDKSIIGDIEKAVRSSDLSLNPSNDGKVIRINIPPLTEERRKEIAKILKNQAEQARVAVRNIRRDSNDELKKLQKNAKLTEDEEKHAEKELNTLTESYVEQITKLASEKEAEIMEV